MLVQGGSKQRRDPLGSPLHFVRLHRPTGIRMLKRNMAPSISTYVTARRGTKSRGRALALPRGGLSYRVGGLLFLLGREAIPLPPETRTAPSPFINEIGRLHQLLAMHREFKAPSHMIAHEVRLRMREH